MAAEEPESLESLLNKAANPFNRQEDWESIIGFCDQVNKELEGPQIAVRLLAHKIQSPQEKEALFALSTLEACVKNCGKRFHQEIGKFRFLNEMIKVVSPKYLGNHTTDKVKRRNIELLYSWSYGLKHEQKILEAYSMLKKQGIVKEDPTYVEQTFQPPPPPPRNAIFEDEDKSKLLARLLKSKHPEDLQAANRLIKNMVKQDAERMEKVSLRVLQLETIQNNVKLLSEMLAQYRSDGTTESERDVMKELFDNLEKQRPNLFRLASNTDEKDNSGITDILKANDEVVKVMTLYKRVVEGDGESNGLLLGMDEGLKGEALSSAMGLDMQSVPLSDPSASFSKTYPPLKNTSSLLDDQLAELGLSTGEGNGSQKEYDELGEIFGAVSQPSTTMATGGLLDLGSASHLGGAMGGMNLSSQPPVYPIIPPPAMSQPLASHSAPGFAAPGMFSGQVGATNNLSGGQPLGSVFSQTTTSVFTNSFSSVSAANTGTSVTGSATSTPKKSAGLDSLDQLGKSLLQKSMPAGQVPQQITSPAPKLPLNQMRPSAAIPPVAPTTASGGSTSGSFLPGGPLLQPQNLVSMSPLPTPPTSVTSSPAKAPLASGDTTPVQPLTDVTVPLESIQPGPHLPLTVYEKNGLKSMIVVAKDRPRPDVVAAVISTISTNTQPIKKFVFQAAVPKAMKVKLQPPSATDLPGYNPILPPAAITQVMLIANPQKERIRLKFKVSYVLEDSTVTDVGDVDTFAVQ